QVLFATICGFGTLVWVLAVRRIGFGGWSRAAIAVAGIGTAAFFASGQSVPGNGSFSLRFATTSSSLLAMAQRILSDASWTGSGAGTFSALVPIYRGGDDAVVVHGVAPTAAAN